MSADPSNPFAVPDDVLAVCESEPIETPGAIQSYGMLLVARRSSLTVVQASANVVPRMADDLAAILGTPIGHWLRAADGTSFSERLLGMGPSTTLSVDLHRLDGTGQTVEAMQCQAHCHGDRILLELEPAPGVPVTSFAARLRQGVADIGAEATLVGIGLRAAAHVRATTGIDRVMVYRFDPEWNGEVIAEDRDPGVESFLGMRFPSTDIPARARNLYRTNRSRLLADRDAPPVALVPPLDPDTGQPTDLSPTSLRAVSPVHLEYLYNMGVRATLVLSLVCEGQLWGLIACHHHAPLYLDQETRFATELLAQVTATRIGDVQRARTLRATLQARELTHSLARLSDSPETWGASLLQAIAPLLAVMQADGVAFVGSRTHHLQGLVPPVAVLRALRQHVLEQTGTASVHVDHLHGWRPDLGEAAAPVCGFLGMRCHPGSEDVLLWFRVERRHHVTWAGAPTKRVHEEAGTVRLSPRLSFERWESIQQRRSSPWQQRDLQVVESLRAGLLDAYGRRQAREKEQALESLLRIEGRIQAAQHAESLSVLASGIAHDFNNLLMGIRCNAELLEQEPSLAAESREGLRDILEATALATDLTRQMLAYAGRGQLMPERLSVSRLIQSVVPLVRVANRRPPISFLPLDDRLHVQGDPTQLRQVIINLLVNAVEAVSPSDGSVTIAVYEEQVTREQLATFLFHAVWQEGPMAVVEVTDNGCGMDAETQRRILEPFFSTKFAGRGLGLAAVMGIIRLHSGALAVQSSPGLGTCFRLYLPLWRGRSSSADAVVLPDGPLAMLVGSPGVLHPGLESSLQDLGLSCHGVASTRQVAPLLELGGDRWRVVLLDGSLSEVRDGRVPGFLASQWPNCLVVVVGIPEVDGVRLPASVIMLPLVCAQELSVLLDQRLPQL